MIVRAKNDRFFPERLHRQHERLIDSQNANAVRNELLHLVSIENLCLASQQRHCIYLAALAAAHESQLLRRGGLDRDL